MADEKKKKDQLSEQQMEKASGGLRGPGQLSQTDRPTSRDDDLRQESDDEQPMPNRPNDITRNVQGNWRPL